MPLEFVVLSFRAQFAVGLECTQLASKHRECVSCAFSGRLVYQMTKDTLLGCFHL